MYVMALSVEGAVTYYIVLVGVFETIDSCSSNKSLVFFCQLVYNIVAFSWLFPTLEGVKLWLCYLL